MPIGQEVIGHLDQLFAEIEGAVRAFPEDLWRRQDPDATWDGGDAITAPRFLEHHTVWCMCLPHLLRIDEGDLPHNLPPDYGPDKDLTQQQVLDLLGDIRASARSIYAEMDNADYLAADAKGQTPLGRVMYTLAHTRHHYGQLVQILRDNAVEPPDWYPLH